MGTVGQLPLPWQGQLKKTFFIAPPGHAITNDHNFCTDTKYPGMKTYLQEDKGKLAGNLAQERKKRQEVRAMILASEEETRKKKRRKREKWE